MMLHTKIRRTKLKLHFAVGRLFRFVATKYYFSGAGSLRSKFYLVVMRLVGAVHYLIYRVR